MRLTVHCLVLIYCFNSATVINAAQDWTRFRGPEGSGKVDGPAIPVEWSSTKNLLWKTPLPGKGSSSPIVSGNYVFLTAYTGYGVDIDNLGKPEDLVRHLIAINRNTGEEFWRASVPTTSQEDIYGGFLTQHGYASSTPATDGERVYAVLGKSGLYAYDLDGKQLWHYDLGQKSDPARWGDGSSPIVVGDLVIVDAGILGNHFVAIDKTSGEKVWSIDDPAFTNCWATPTPYGEDGSQQILFHVPKKVIAVDPVSGEQLWTVDSPLDDATCGSIVTDEGKAFLMGSRAGNALAFDCTPDASEDRVLWKTGLRSGIATPIISGENLYWASGGVFYAASLETGEYVYKKRLPRIGGPTGGFPNANYSSPVAVGENIIQFTRNGESYVIRPGNEFDLVSHNAAFDGDESAFSATPAISDGQLFVRSESFLYCIGKSEEK